MKSLTLKPVIIIISSIMLSAGCSDIHPNDEAQKEANPIQLSAVPPSVIVPSVQAPSSTRSAIHAARVDADAPAPHSISKWVSVSKLFTPHRADTLTLCHTTLVVPTGSLRKPLILSITELNEGDFPKIPGDIINVTAGAKGYRFLPHGHHFTGCPAEVSLPYDVKLIPKGYEARDIRTFYYDEDRHKWTALSTIRVDEKSRQIYASTGHFTDMINGIIRVPEAPVTQGFTPTTMNSLKAASPATGMTAVEAPTANASGTASLGYPFSLPSGRNNMQPSLSLNYSSEGGSGWTGYGWSLSTPTVDIDTRWGVPRFDAATESENYLIGGEQMTNTTQWQGTQEPRTSDRQFRPRVDQGFSRIIRHGDSPKNYWWEVTTTAGTHSCFGGRNGSQNDGYVIRDGAGNIVQWALCQNSDPNGNTVRYHYDKVGNMLVPARISYTGYGDEEGKYEVRFVRAEGSSNTRTDRTSNGRLGLLQTDGEQLQSVDIYYAGGKIRSYRLNYKQGAFGKMMLESVSQQDGQGKELGSNKFDYYDDVKNGMYGDIETWGTGKDLGNGFYGQLVKMINPAKALKDNVEEALRKPSMISSAYGDGYSVGGGFSAGVGKLYGGVSYLYNHSASNAYITLTDINGDGLPDKIYTTGNGSWNQIYYRPNLKGKFGPPVLLPTAGSKFAYTVSTSHTLEGDLGISGSNAGVGASYSHSWNKSETSIYFQDFNGDGLLDLVRNGTVYFNRLVDGVPTFVSTSHNTPNPIMGTRPSGIDSHYIPDYAIIRDSLERQFPLHDVVRSWTAPFDGVISIHYKVEKSHRDSSDGVKYRLQVNDKDMIVDSISDAAEKAGDLTQIKIGKGQSVFFRLQSRYGGTHDETSTYMRIVYSQSEYLHKKDENGLSLDTFDSHRDYVQGEAPQLVLAGNGPVSIRAPYSKEALTEDLDMRVYRIVNNKDTALVKDTILPSTAVTHGEIRFDENLQASDTVTYLFHAGFKSSVDLSKFRWKAIASFGDGSQQIATPQRTQYNNLLRFSDSANMDTSSLFSVPDSVINSLKNGIYKKDSIKTDSVAILHHIYLLPVLKTKMTKGISSANATMAIRYADSTAFAHDSCYLRNGKIEGGHPIYIGNSIPPKVSIGYYVDNVIDEVDSAYVRLGDSISVVAFDSDKVSLGTLSLNQLSKTKLEASVYSYTDSDFGQMYRGWGQFAYNGNRERENKPMPLKDLVIDKEKYKNIKESQSVDKNQLIRMSTPIESQIFYSMSYNAKDSRYSSLCSHAYVTRDTQCCTRLTEEEIRIDSVFYPNDGTPAPSMVSRGINDNYSGNVSGGQTSMGMGYSVSYSNNEDGVIDINGDRYPDWFSRDDSKMKVHFTSPQGDLAEKLTIDNRVPMQEAKAVSGSVGVNGVAAIKATTKADGPEDDPSINNTDNACKGMEAGSVSFSASGNFSTNTSTNRRTWGDINGDGLIDMVSDDGTVSYNVGYGFLPSASIDNLGTDVSESSSNGAGLGVSVQFRGPFQRIGGGANISWSDSHCSTKLLDVNGDGLSDMLYIDNILQIAYVRFNTGSGFTESQNWCFIDDKSHSNSQSAYLNISIPIHFPIFDINCTTSINASTDNSLSTTQSTLMDMDGDGYPDIVTSDSEESITVRCSKIGRTNMLRTVTQPFGGTITFDYTPVGNTYDLPLCKRVLASVTVCQSMVGNGATSMKSTFEYDDGYYDRRERCFFGFGKVTTRQLDTENKDALYRSVVSTYNNHSLYLRNLPLSSVTTDANGALMTETTNTYRLVKADADTNSVHPQLTQTISTMYDAEGNSISQTETYESDVYGNIIRYTSQTAADAVSSEVTYHHLSDLYIHNVPATQSVDAGGKEYRHSETKMNDEGDITEISQRIGDSSAIYSMEYDQYGNLTDFTKPANYRGQRMTYHYIYDDAVHSLPVSVKDAYGYESKTEYDYALGVPTRVTDLNGNAETYTYDSFGRLMTVTAPYEADSGSAYTVACEYHPEAKVPYAVTRNHTVQGDIRTFTFCDPWMREVQVKKDAIVYAGGSSQPQLVVSVRIVYDAFDRTRATYSTTTESPSIATAYSTATGDYALATTEYDAWDRAVRTTLADGTVSSMNYRIAEHAGERMLRQESTDPIGRKTEVWTDQRGRTRSSINHAASGDVEVDYAYDPVGDLLQVTHPNGKITTYTYDGLGRKLTVSNADAGKTVYTYDAAGNLLTRLTAQLAASIGSNAEIKYTYDYERPSEVLYPKNIYNRVTYTYGAPGAGHNQAGRLYLLEDGSGGTEYQYGKMGEVTRTVRSIIVNESDVRTYVSTQRYDSWNRLMGMVYPDGEKVTYLYDAAGNLRGLDSRSGDSSRAIIADMGYDKDGHVVYQRMGNGTVSVYSYDPRRMHLSEMQVTTPAGPLMHNTYTYDKVDNITRMSNDAVPAGASIGSSYCHSYVYDELNRLTSANGVCGEKSYTFAMTYDAMSNPLTKTQTISTGGKSQTVNQRYGYEGSHPDAVTDIAGTDSAHYVYDANGNPTTISTDSSTREILWDEENRVRAIDDDGYVSRYTYDASGTRVVKSHGPMEGIYINGMAQGILYHDEDHFTIYVSPYLTQTNGRITKHYYAGSTRVASKIDGGDFNNIYGVSNSYYTAGRKDYSERMAQIEQGKTDYYKQNGVVPGVPTQKGVLGEPENMREGFNNTVLGDYSVPSGWPTAPKFNHPGDVPGPPNQWQDPANPDSIAPGYGYEPDTAGNAGLFFYHSDQIGSTAYVTDDSARVTQFVTYLPYGETLTEQHTTDEDLSYKFSAKELDDITGLYDHGARSRNPITISWYNVDPLFEMYPEISPYSYCHANPVRFVDPTGMFDTEKEAKRYARRHNASESNVEYAKDKKEWYVLYGEDGKGYRSGGYLERRFCSDPKSKLGKINAVSGAFGNSFGVQEQLFEYVVRSSGNSEKTLREYEKISNTGKVSRTSNVLGKAGSKYLKGTKLIGKACFFITLGTAGASVYDAYSNDSPDKTQRSIKAVLDVTVGAVAVWGGPVGWGVGAVYYVVDVAGGWDYLLKIEEEK